MDRNQRLAGLLLMLALQACNQTVYLRDAAPEDSAGAFGREVRYKLSSDIYKKVPDCAIVLPTKGKGRVALKEGLSQALARHMALKLRRIVAPMDRDRLVRRYSIDLAGAEGVRFLAQRLQCPFAVQTEVLDVEETYLGVWSRKQVAVKLTLFHIRDDLLLWTAFHAVSRQDGDIPLSPFSLGAGIYKAGVHIGDADMIPSMSDDAIRRMMVTLPDFR